MKFWHAPSADLDAVEAFLDFCIFVAYCFGASAVDEDALFETGFVGRVDVSASVVVESVGKLFWLGCRKRNSFRFSMRLLRGEVDNELSLRCLGG
jgi:hypothetical protein